MRVGRLTATKSALAHVKHHARDHQHRGERENLRKRARGCLSGGILHVVLPDDGRESLLPWARRDGAPMILRRTPRDEYSLLRVPTPRILTAAGSPLNAALIGVACGGISNAANRLARQPVTASVGPPPKAKGRREAGLHHFSKSQRQYFATTGPPQPKR